MWHKTKKQYFQFTLSCLVCICICFISNSQTLAKSTILVLGDSLSAAYLMPNSEGWVSLLEQRLKKQNLDWKIVNSSIVGDTTASGKRRLPKLLEEHQPNIVILELGGNDGLRGLPHKRIRKNIENMVSAIQQQQAKVLLVGIKLPPNYGDRYANGFYNIYQNISKQYSLPLIPFLLDKIALVPELMLPDGIHPTSEAQPIILNTVWKHLEPML